MTWIDKNDAMPEEGQEVEVLGDDGIVRNAEGCHFGDKEGFLVNATADFATGNMHYEVTHWRVPNAKSQATDAALSRQVACTDGLGAAVPPAPTFEQGD